jgi:uncharacterized protein YbaR (Trm112 family)
MSKINILNIENFEKLNNSQKMPSKSSNLKDSQGLSHKIGTFSESSIICCPDCKSDLEQNGKKFTCVKCKNKFREKEGILILINKELEDELRKFKHEK